MANIENTSSNQVPVKKDTALIATLVIVVVAVALIALIGFLFLKPAPEIVEGQAEATSVKISGKLPGRVMEIFVEEGQNVKAGDTLIHIHSSLADAKLYQAEAMKAATAAQNKKIDAGTRKQIVQGAHDVWQQAVAARTIAEKTYNRMKALFKQDVISAQKRDEAKAAYDAAVAGESAAKSQYMMAKEGAQREDKESAQALVDAAKGGIMEVEALLQDQYLTAPADGQIDVIYPHEGELVSLGAPLMNLLKISDKWVTFNVREEKLNNLPIGKKIDIMIPALDKKKIQAEVYYVRDMGTYATWRSTKATGEWDSRTFQIKARPLEDVPELRPGMSIIYLDGNE
ncbi:MAG: efflux RND transporter periplasmic adaptor subunit [Bacteroides sp.]|nr:efflux RND transporter periplasmic adaptor subunit [Bacteroides sp.]MCM1389104.1 efflux RND transporter periplasmic adaptor subunit [Bacteroides sp.]